MISGSRATIWGGGIVRGDNGLYWEDRSLVKAIENDEIDLSEARSFLDHRLKSIKDFDGSLEELRASFGDYPDEDLWEEGFTDQYELNSFIVRRGKEYYLVSGHWDRSEGNDKLEIEWEEVADPTRQTKEILDLVATRLSQ